MRAAPVSLRQYNTFYGLLAECIPAVLQLDWGPTVLVRRDQAGPEYLKEALTHMLGHER